MNNRKRKLNFHNIQARDFFRNKLQLGKIGS